MCLEKGSRDNMTASVILFDSGVTLHPPEGVCGVAKRRRRRDEEAKAREEQDLKEQGGGGLGTGEGDLDMI